MDMLQGWDSCLIVIASTQKLINRLIAWQAICHLSWSVRCIWIRLVSTLGGSGELNNGLLSVYCLFIHHNDFIVCILRYCFYLLLMCRNLLCRQKTKDTENWYVSKVQYKAGASITRPQQSLWVKFHNWLFIKKNLHWFKEQEDSRTTTAGSQPPTAGALLVLYYNKQQWKLQQRHW